MPISVPIFKTLPGPIDEAKERGVDKTQNTEHSGTCRNIPEPEKIKIIFMKKKK